MWIAEKQKVNIDDNANYKTFFMYLQLPDLDGNLIRCLCDTGATKCIFSERSIDRKALYYKDLQEEQKLTGIGGNNLSK